MATAAEMIRLPLIALVLTAVGCDGRVLQTLDAARPDAPTDAPAKDTLLPPECTPDADQSCNADPAMSGQAGYCNVHGHCMCLPGFTYDAGTRRCRPESTCPTVAGESPRGASGPPLCRAPCPGEWQVVVSIDVFDCAARAIADCPFGGSGLMATLAQDCRIPSYTYLRVDFTMGCPTRLLARARGGAPSQEQLDCLTAALASWRWQCTLDLSCTLYEMDTLR